MSEIVELRGTLRDYAWGSRDFLSRFLGFDPHAALDGDTGPAAGAEAEWWMGAHATSPSWVRLEKGWRPLSLWIAEDPEARLGRKSHEAFGDELPFLFKILAADQPLSLQAHPDAEQARTGFEREEREGVPREAPGRSYRDPNPKPELICALTAFDALVGFRSSEAILGDLADVAPDALRELAEPLRSRGDAGLRDFFSALWTSDAARWLPAVVERCRARDRQPADAWVGRLATAHPGDVGAVAPLLLHHVHLEPGQAMYLPARELHSYLRGAGLELMGNSDNVLRSGLTKKYVDLGELLEILDFRARPPQRISPVERQAGEYLYRTEASCFELSRLEVRGTYVESQREGFGIVLCESGQGTISAAGAPSGLELSRGVACAISARVRALEIDGDLILHRAALPRV